MCKVFPMTDAANGKGIQGNDRPSPCLEATPKEQPHKHAAVIKAWADGAEIELKVGPGSNWQPTNKPAWVDCYEYRVKPTPVPLWQIARTTWLTPAAGAEVLWKRVAEAVVKAHEERGRVA